MRQSVSHRTVFAALAVSLALAFAGAVYVYQRYVRYVPRVLSHVPDDYAVALRLDVEQAVVYEPFRLHLLTLLEAGRPVQAQRGASGLRTSDLPPRLDALRSATTVEFGVDLRELGVVVNEAGEWLVLLGGHFRRDGVVRGVAEVLEREGVALRLESGPERLIHGSGAAFGVASDGVLVLAATDELLQRTLEAESKTFRFPVGTALSLAVGAGGPSPLAGLSVDIWPGQDFPVEARLPLARGGIEAQDLGPLLTGKTGDFKLFRGVGAWQSVRSRPGEGPSRATSVLTRAEFDGVVAELSLSLRVLIGLGDAGQP